jgi:hypothetical protein
MPILICISAAIGAFFFGEYADSALLGQGVYWSLLALAMAINTR